MHFESSLHNLPPSSLFRISFGFLWDLPLVKSEKSIGLALPDTASHESRCSSLHNHGSATTLHRNTSAGVKCDGSGDDATNSIYRQDGARRILKFRSAKDSNYRQQKLTSDAYTSIRGVIRQTRAAFDEHYEWWRELVIGEWRRDIDCTCFGRVVLLQLTCNYGIWIRFQGSGTLLGDSRDFIGLWGETHLV